MKNLALAFCVFLVAPVKLYASDCVILLHGLARSDSSMSKIEQALVKEGYIAINFGYDSTQKDIKTLSNEAIPQALERCPTDVKVNFVTHSMGGILLRQYLSNNRVPSLNHVVMLGPPNKGSEVVDKLKEVPGFKLINGPAGLELGTGELSVPNQLGAVDYSVGIIAGTRSINLILSMLIPNSDDGKVSVENTKLDGMDDHIAMPVTHTFMMKNPKVIAQVIYYLEHGSFQREE